MRSLTRPSRQTMITLALVVVLGLVAGWTVVANDTGGPTTARPAFQEASEAPTDAPAPTETATGLDQLPLVTYEVFLARDPFQPVVPEENEGGGGGTGVVPGVDGGGGTPVVGPTPSPSPGATPGQPGQPVDDTCSRRHEVVCNGRVVSLLDITTADDGTRTAVVQIGSQVYEVRDGDRFADNFEVTSISATCVSLLFGDDAFTLCIGEQVLK